MAGVSPFDDETKKAIGATICKLVSEGRHLGPVLAAVGIGRTTWHDWRAADPEMADQFARAQELYAEALVLECPEVARDATLDPKTKRVIVDTNLKVAALICPRRFSQAALDRAVAPPPEDETKRTPAEIAAAIRASLTVASRLELPAPVDAEFHEVKE